jgi:hypothetical protein
VISDSWPAISWLALLLLSIPIQWIGSELLSRYGSPKLWDWWARKSRARATKRAEKILAQYRSTVFQASDPRLLSLWQTGHLYYMAYVGLSMLMPLIAMGQVVTIEIQNNLVVLIWIGVSFSVWLCFVAIAMRAAAQIRKMRQSIRSPSTARIDVAERLRKLWTAAGCQDEWIEHRLEELPLIPSFTVLRLGDPRLEIR